MRYIIILAAAVFIAACVHPAAREFHAWAEQTKPLAESGQLKWSDYYKEAYKKISELPEMRGKASAMERANLLITASLAYEGGRMSKDDFESIRRASEAAAQRESESANAARGAAFGEALKNYGEARYGAAATQRQMIPTPQVPIYQQPKQIQCSTYGNQTSCNEY